MRLAYFCFLLCVFSLPFSAQNTASNSYIFADLNADIEHAELQNPNQTFHSSFKPYTGFLPAISDSVGTPLLTNSQAIGFKILAVNKNALRLLPLLDLEIGQDLLLKKALPYLGLGAQANYEFGTNFAAQIRYFGGAASFPFFIDTTVSKTKVLPESGLLQANTVGTLNGFSNLTGYVSWRSKNKVFNVQTGRDKFFIGDGYRSVLLSDFSAPYPFLRAGATVWKLQYQVWYTAMNDPTQANGVRKNFEKKYGAFHYLSYNVTKHFAFGVFENVVWRGSDSNQTRLYELNYLNPLVFYRPQEYSLGSPDNSMLGLNCAYSFARQLKVYAQLALDEFYLKEIRAHQGWWANKQAWQFGAKWLNAFTVKGLRLQVEYNEVRPFTYSHGIPSQNYAHYGLALAHPAGSNFREFLALANYSKNKWQFGAQAWYLYQGLDSSATLGNYGDNIFRSYTQRAKEYGNVVGQGDLHKTLQSQVKAAYLLNNKLQLWLELGYIQRAVSSLAGYQLQNPYVYLNLRSRLWNRYRDY